MRGETIPAPSRDHGPFETAGVESMKFLKPAPLFAALAFATAALLSGTAVAADIVIKHKQGETTLAGKPEKVLVFDLASLDTLGALGVEVTGVPRGVRPNSLKGYNDDKYG